MQRFHRHIDQFRPVQATASSLLALLVMLSGTWFSCTSTSQVPLSVRQQQERQAQADTADESGAAAAEEAAREREEAELQRKVEERKALAEALESDYLHRTNESLSHFMKAQTSYFNGRSTLALHHIQQALNIYETADFHALKGAIYYRLGDPELSAAHWRKAVEMDAEVVSDIYPGMKNWYERWNRD